MPLELVTAPTVEPITLEEAKAQVRKTESDEDYYVETVLMPAVRDRAELATQRQLVNATWRLRLDAFPCVGWIDVPRPPLQSVTSIVYVDTAGDEQTWAVSNYLVDNPSGPRCARGRITPAYGVSWPSTRAQINAVTIEFVAGYGTSAVAVPPLLRKAMLRDLGSLFEHREDVVVGTISSELPRSSASVYRSFKSYARLRGAL